MRCVPPALDDWASGAPRDFAGAYRVELSANDQQWTQQALRFEYLVPWHTVALYPSSGPAAGGTFVQVGGRGLAASATGEVDAAVWRDAFASFDADADAHLTSAELLALVTQLRADQSLPEQVLATSPAVLALLSDGDADADGTLSFGEFVGARPTLVGAGHVNSSVDVPRCAFGNASVAGDDGWGAGGATASVRDGLAGEWVGCTSPPAGAAGADASVMLRFGDGEPLPGLAVYAATRVPNSHGDDPPVAVRVTDSIFLGTMVQGGMLRLTEAEPNVGGSALLALPPLPPGVPVPANFRASFLVRVHGGSGGDGLSFSYGEIADGYIDEFGSGDGLRLLLRTAGAEQAALMWQGATLRTTPLPGAALRDAWRRVAVQYSAAGASATLDDVPLFEDVPLPGFRPQPSWRVAIGARCGSLHDAHWIDELSVTRGAAAGAGTTLVQLSVNGRDFTSWPAAAEGVRFVYYQPPLVSSISPACGPVAGGTLVRLDGQGLLGPDRTGASACNDSAAFGGACNSGYKCGWGGVCACERHTDCACENVTAASWDAEGHSLRCYSPDWSARTPAEGALPAVPLELSLNGQDFGRTGFFFARYRQAESGFELLEVHPVLGPAAGGTTLSTRPFEGTDSGCDFVCRFGRRTSPATADGTRTTCVTPLAEPADVRVALAFNGQQFAEVGARDQRFRYFPVPQVAAASPSAGPAGGGTLLRLTGCASAPAPTTSTPTTIPLAAPPPVTPAQVTRTGHAAGTGHLRVQTSTDNSAAALQRWAARLSCTPRAWPTAPCDASRPARPPSLRRARAAHPRSQPRS